jgi:hypothetical protein
MTCAVSIAAWRAETASESAPAGILTNEEFESSLPHERTLLLAVVATISISVFARGLTSRPLTNRYVRWYASHPREELPAMESVPTATHRWRKPQAPAAELASQSGTEHESRPS